MHSIDKVDLVVAAAQARRLAKRPQSLDYYKPRLIVHEVKMLTPKAKPDALDATIQEARRQRHRLDKTAYFSYTEFKLVLAVVKIAYLICTEF